MSWLMQAQIAAATKAIAFPRSPGSVVALHRLSVQISDPSHPLHGYLQHFHTIGKEFWPSFLIALNGYPQEGSYSIDDLDQPAVKQVRNHFPGVSQHFHSGSRIAEVYHAVVPSSGRGYRVNFLPKLISATLVSRDRTNTIALQGISKSLRDIQRVTDWLPHQLGVSPQSCI